MCLLIVAKEKFPSPTLLKIAEEQNEHGGGIAWTEGKHVVYKKGLTADEIYNLRGQVSFPCIIHFRKSTVGKDDKGLNHPFPVQEDVSTALEGKAKKVLAHNGTWINWKEALFSFMNGNSGMYDHSKGSTDTRAMAWLYHQYGSLGDLFLSLLNEKVAVLEPNKVKTFGSGWVEKEDLLLSNNPQNRWFKGHYNWDDIWKRKI